MIVVKSVSADTVYIHTVDDDGLVIDFQSPSGAGPTWNNVFNNSKVYDVTVTLTPSGRAAASISIKNGSNTVVASTASGTTLSFLNVNPNTAGITVTIGP